VRRQAEHVCVSQRAQHARNLSLVRRPACSIRTSCVSRLSAGGCCRPLHGLARGRVRVSARGLFCNSRNLSIVVIGDRQRGLFCYNITYRLGGAKDLVIMWREFFFIQLHSRTFS
jgi:hypothetical protein